MRVQPGSKRSAAQLVEKGAATARAAAIVQFEIAAAGIQCVGHGDHRGNADTATDQDRAPGIAGQRKVIARQADLDLAPFLQPLMHRHRTAPRGGILEYPQAIGAGVGRIATQRILTNQPSLEMDIDMRARLERGQGLSRRIAQIQHDDTFALLFALVHDNFQ